MFQNDVLLTVRNLNVIFKNGNTYNHAVKDVSFDVYQGEVLGLAGESGSGKSTVARSIMRLQRTNSGDIFWNNLRINGSLSRSEAQNVVGNIQMIFQDPAASVNDRCKVLDILCEGLMNVRKGLTAAERKQIAAKALIEVGMRPEDMNRFPYAFSGGQLQRIGIARALLVHPTLVIADEPVSSLDLSVRSQIIDLLNELKNSRNLTYLFISHDLSLMRHFCDRIAVMRRGEIVEIGRTEQLFDNPVNPYTRMLLSAIPVPNPDVEQGRTFYMFEDTDIQTHQWTEVESGHFALK